MGPITEPMMNKRHKDKSVAIEAFLANKIEIDTMRAPLTALSEEHYNTDPETLRWGHVGKLEFYASLLRRTTDLAFKEGEHTV